MVDAIKILWSIPHAEIMHIVAEVKPGHDLFGACRATARSMSLSLVTGWETAGPSVPPESPSPPPVTSALSRFMPTATHRFTHRIR